MSQRGVRLHEVEREGKQYTARIAVPDYNPADPHREISAGWFQGSPRGILIRARPDDMRAVARALIEAADQIGSGAIQGQSA